MDDLINQIVEKTGVTAQQAQDGVGLAVEWVKERLPSDVVDQFGGVLDGAGNMASGAVDKAKDAGGSVSSLASSGAGASGSAWDKAKGAVSDLMPGDE
jgi:hypothetical protein